VGVDRCAPPRKIQLSEQDLDLLAFLAEHRLALPEHAAALLGVQPTTARARLSRLVEVGCVRFKPVFHRQPPMYLITRAGLNLLGSSLPPPRLDLRVYEHDVGVAWLWLAACAGVFGPVRQVIAERRLRSYDAARDSDPHRAEPLGVRLGGVGPRGQERLHYPDLLLHTADGRRIALELELSAKGRRLEAILSGYAADRRVDGVVYLVESESVARAVRDTARRIGLSSLIHLQRVRLTARRPGAARAPVADRTAPGRRATAADRTRRAPDRTRPGRDRPGPTVEPAR
jgi:hypothetical protein